MYEYLTILIIILIVTLVLERTQRVHLYNNRRERFEITGLFFIIAVIWDSYAIWRGSWTFPPGKNIGVVIGVMPLEEYLFALIVPYFIITVYRLLDSKFRKHRN